MGVFLSNLVMLYNYSLLQEIISPGNECVYVPFHLNLKLLVKTRSDYENFVDLYKLTSQSNLDAGILNYRFRNFSLCQRVYALLGSDSTAKHCP